MVLSPENSLNLRPLLWPVAMYGVCLGMATKRARPNWIIYNGGPLHEQREMLNPCRFPGARVGRLVPSADGTPRVHEYVISDRKRPRNGHVGSSLIADYIGPGERLRKEDEPPVPIPQTPQAKVEMCPVARIC